MARLPQLLGSLARPALSSSIITTTTTTAAAAHTAAFSTSAALGVKTIRAAHIPSAFVPPYPYGERTLYKQSNKGLYGLARIRFGNHVASGRNPIKSRRTWKPNVHRKRMWSDALGAWIKVRMTIRVFRTIIKDGSLDNYLLKNKPRRIRELGPGGWKLRWLIMQTDAVRARWLQERTALGLPERSPEDQAAIDREAQDMVQIAVDYATPGPLSRVTRDLLKMRDEEGVWASEEFELGQAEEHEGVEVEGDYEKEYIGANDGVEAATETGASQGLAPTSPETPKPAQ
ncbi:50s ribosomal protein l24 [Ceratocystis lukuohia]|uniref:50s ribosomal protein l24 n=1 Tax=Ceratocystis lukuohia TaxID=2019550 RepID=A0ABR4MUS1_9PEZI